MAGFADIKISFVADAVSGMHIILNLDELIGTAGDWKCESRSDEQMSFSYLTDFWHDPAELSERVNELVAGAEFAVRRISERSAKLTLRNSAR